MKHRKLAKDSTWNAIDYISTLVIFLVTTKLLIAEFGAAGYGFYIFFVSLVGFFGMVDMGMGMAVSKYLSEFLHKKDYHRSSQIINVALAFYLAMSSVIALMVYAFTIEILNFLRFEGVYFEAGLVVLKLVAVVFIVNLVISIPTNVLVALEEWFSISLINIVFKILSAGILIYILLLDISEFEKFVFIFTMVLAVSLVKLLTFLTVLKLKSFQYFFVLPNPDIKTKVFSFLKYSSIQYFLSLLVGHLDKFIISRFFGLEALGVYSFCVNAFVYLYGFIVNALKVFYPKLSRLHGEENIEALKQSFLRLLLLTFAIALLAALSLIVFWDFAISLYIDQDFATATFYFIPFFALFLIARSPEVVMHYFFNATANPKMLVRNLMIGAPITFGLYFIMVPWLGVEGLIVSQILGVITVYTWHLYMIKTKGFKAHALQS